MTRAEHYRTLIRRLQAAGWSLDWQEEHCGFIGVTVGPLIANAVHPDVAAAIDRMAAFVGERAATEANSGQSAAAISAAQTTARDLGYYPPMAYDEDTGELDIRAVHDHPWSRADELAATRLEMCRQILDGVPAKVVAANFGKFHRSVSRVMAAALIRVFDSGKDKARVRAVLDIYDEGESDPVYLALSLGILSRRRVAKDHPGFLRWAAEQAGVPAPEQLTFTTAA